MDGCFFNKFYGKCEMVFIITQENAFSKGFYSKPNQKSAYLSKNGTINFYFFTAYRNPLRICVCKTVSK